MHPLEKMKTDFFAKHKNAENYFRFDLPINKSTKSGFSIENWAPLQSKEWSDFLNNWDGKTMPTETPEPAIDKYERLLANNNMPDELPDIGKLVLYNSSKLTDFLYGSFFDNHGFIVSRMVKGILSRYNLGPHKFYPIVVDHNGYSNKHYSFLCIGNNAIDFVDYKKSSFYIEEVGIPPKAIEINSIEELKRKRMDLEKGLILASQVILNPEFPKYDFINFKDLGIYQCFISKSLYNSFEKLNGSLVTTNRIGLSEYNNS